MARSHRPTAGDADDSAPGLAEDPDDLAQIRQRLLWTPAQRIAYLRDMLAFEQRARRARQLR